MEYSTWAFLLLAVGVTLLIAEVFIPSGGVISVLATLSFAGAVVCVIKDGKVLFAKGYGYSNVEKKAPVSPDSTLFRPGSISTSKSISTVARW